MQNVAFIVHGKYGRFEQLVKEIADCSSDEIQGRLFKTEYSGHAELMSKECSEQGYDRIIACGGDGTLSQVVNGIMDAKAEIRPMLGLLPIGSGNDFSRIIQKRTITDFCAIEIQPKMHDMCRISFGDHTRHSINMVAGGLGAEVGITVNKRKFPMPVALNYYLGIVQWLIKYRSPKLRITIDNEVIDRQCFLTAIGKGRYVGNGNGLLPQSAVDDGLLSLCLIGNVTVLDFIRYLGDLKAARKIIDPRVTYHQGKSVKIEVLDRSLAVDTEGEFFTRVEAGQSITFSILPKALQVI